VGFGFQNDLRELRLNSDGNDCLFLCDINGWMDGWMDGKREGWVDGWMDRWVEL